MADTDWNLHSKQLVTPTDVDRMLIEPSDETAKAVEVGGFREWLMNTALFSTLTTTAKNIIGAIEEVKGIADSNTTQLNANTQNIKDNLNYNYKNSNNLIIGMEYLNYYHTKLRNHQKTTLVFSGDSTTYGTSITDANYKINALAKDFIENNGGNICTSINAGHENMDTSVWLSTYLDQDLAQNPDLYILRWGVNDGSTQSLTTRLNTFVTNLKTGLAKIRTSKTADQLSIILMMPNSTDDDIHNRNSAWYDEIYPYLVQIARDYKCCLVDTYHFMKDCKNVTWTDTQSDGTHIHPLETANMNFITLLSDCLVPTYIRNRKQPFEISFANGWGTETGYELNAYKVGNKVSISTSITGGTCTAITSIGILPEGFRPKKQTLKTMLTRDTTGNIVMGYFMIQPAGSIVVINNIWNTQVIFDFEYTI